MEDEELKNPPPPSAEHVARRAVILSAVSYRGFLEGDRLNPKGAAVLAQNSRDWLNSLGIDKDLNTWERQILDAPFGSLSERDCIDASWLSEAVVVMAWALQRAELPRFDEPCDPAESANSLGFLLPKRGTVLNRPKLRKAAIMGEYNEVIYNVHWRVRDFSLYQRSYDFEALARKAWGEPVLRHGLVIAEKDLCVNGTSISRADEGDLHRLMSITQERHRASNWMIGYASENFYDVTTDT